MVVKENRKDKYLFGISFFIEAIYRIPYLRTVRPENLYFEIIVERAEPVQIALSLNTQPELNLFISAEGTPVKRPFQLLRTHSAIENNRLGKGRRR